MILDRDVAAQPRVARAIHLTHAAGAEEADDFVGTQFRANRKRHERRRSV